MNANSLPASHADRLRVLVIDAHPRADSFCRALAAAAAEGAGAAAHEVRVVALRELDFDLHHRGQELEPCLVQSQQDLLWAGHLIIVHPVWWGTMPALLKGWLDRVLLPGFAFAEREDGGWEGRLSGRSATLVSTMDTPVWVYRWILRAPGLRALRDATLGFCGIRTVQVLLLAALRHSSRARRQRWLEQARLAGYLLDRALRSGWWPRLRAWLQALRLQFYVFPSLALTAGAISAASDRSAPFQWAPWLLGVLSVWLLEGITVLTNDIHDSATDTANRNSGPFTGGSRVLVQGLLKEGDLRRGRAVAGLGLAIVSAGFALMPGVHVPGVFMLLAAGLVLGLGYSAPPLKLASRTWGEVTVALTHSVLVIMLGHVSQGGGAGSQPWFLALPVFLAILPSITLAGFPDFEADASVGKKTFVVRFGRPAATALAMAAVVIAAVLRMSLHADPAWLSTAILAHASALLLMLGAYLRQPSAGRINGLLLLALSYMLWFAWVT